MQSYELSGDLLDELRLLVKDVERKTQRNLNSQTTKVNIVLVSFPKAKP